MINKLVLLIFSLGLIFQAGATSKLHLGSSSTGSPTVLRGRTLIGAAPAETNSGSPNLQLLQAPTQRVLEFAVELKQDAVLFDELVEDGVHVISCSRDAAARKATIRLGGDSLDSSDFDKGTAFVIDVDEWEKNCARVLPVEGVDEADDALFYVINNMSSDEQTVFLEMDIVSGSEVAPNVDIDIREEAAFVTSLPKKVVFDDSPLFATTESLLATARTLIFNDTLPVVTRPSISAKTKVTLFKGAELEVDASLSASINKFKVKRLFKTEVQWEQNLEARLDAELTVAAKFEGERSGEIFRKPIPKFGFSARIPFVGRIRAGAFGKVEWVAEVEVEAALRASIHASHHNKQRVTARIIPPRFESRNLLPNNAGSSGRSSLTFENEAQAGITGFVGLRPAIGVELTLGKKGVEGNIGAKLGLEASTTFKNPPFTPFSGGGLKIGECDQCHRLRGALKIKGKDLGVQLLKNGEVTQEKILVGELFEIRLGTLCALTAPTCNTDESSMPSPPSPPAPGPGKCRKCSAKKKCPTGSSCVRGVCKRSRRIGQRCGPCGRCISSSCTGRRCKRISRPLPLPLPLPLPRPVPIPKLPGGLPVLLKAE
ncbi:hypothetical protein FGB62_39g04 [Gracilaria domingensis]|nr:hypothetical protein FGB62_39g04 [Gracilaria domingensis]